MEERRRYKRESLAPFTEIFPEDGSEPISGYPIDMSRGGLALEADAPMALGDKVNVAIHFDPVDEEEGDDHPVEFIQSVVKRVDKMGEHHKVSVEFVGLSEVDHPILYGVLQFIDG